MLSSLAKRVAANERVDLRNVQGTGPHGRIIKDDVLKAQGSGSAGGDGCSAIRWM